MSIPLSSLRLFFIKTNVEGTGVLLDACVKFAVEKFHQISTDEVYGDKPLDYDWRGFTEESPLQPSSPYAPQRHQQICYAWLMLERII